MIEHLTELLDDGVEYDNIELTTVLREMQDAINQLIMEVNRMEGLR